MVVLAEKCHCTLKEYLLLERGALERHEYRDGEVRPIPAESYRHSLVNANVTGLLANALRGRTCRVLGSDLKICIARSRNIVYADAMVIRKMPEFAAPVSLREMIANPQVIIEVLSATTEAYDRGEKFNRYRELESFEEYILVSQSRPSIETFYRQPDGTWLFTPYSGLEAIAKIRSVGVDLLLSEVYGGVDFAAAQSHDTQTA